MNINERNVLIGMVVILTLLTYVLEVTAGEYSIGIVAGFLLFGSGACSIIFYSHSQRKEKFQHLDSYKPFVSIIIPAKNEEKVIRDTVDNIMLIDYRKYDNTPNFELIIIDDGSTDRTADILSGLKKAYPNLYVNHRLPNRQSNKSKALNSTLPLYAGEILCIFDADAKVNPDFLNKVIPYFSDRTVGAVQVRKKIVNGSYNLLTASQENELCMAMELENQRDKNSGVVALWGNGMIVRKEALIMVGGWNNNALTEDSDMSINLHLHNWKVRFCSEAFVYEEAVTEWTPFLKQRFRWAEGNIRGCLNYFVQIINTPMPMVKKIDMVSSVMAFALPIWLVTDMMFLFADKSNERSVFLSIIMYVVVSLLGGLWINITSGFKILKHKEYKDEVFTSFFNIMGNAVYSLHWVPIALMVVGKVLLNQQPSTWNKTEHGDAPCKVKNP